MVEPMGGRTDATPPPRLGLGWWNVVATAARQMWRPGGMAGRAVLLCVGIAGTRGKGIALPGTPVSRSRPHCRQLVCQQGREPVEPPCSVVRIHSSAGLAGEGIAHQIDSSCHTSVMESEAHQALCVGIGSLLPSRLNAMPCAQWLRAG